MSLPETATDRMKLLDELIAEQKRAGIQEQYEKVSGPRIPGRSGLPKGYPLSAHHRASIDATAALMRTRNRQTPRTWTGLVSKSEGERIARRIEQGRREPYKVIYECHGEMLTFGFTDQASGGMPLNMARLIPWVKNPRVVAA